MTSIGTHTPVIKVLIVEDEMIIAAKISLHIEQMGYIVQDIITRGEDVIPHCQKSEPDILLLDINLKGKMSGIDVAQSLIELGINVPVIFLTANTDDETFESAKKTAPYAFISKPYKKIELKRALELTIENSKQKSVDHLINDSFLLSDRIFVRKNDRMVKIFLKEILFVEAERSYCCITTSTSEYMLSIPLKDLAIKLNTAQIVRVHRSFVVNLSHVDEVTSSHAFIKGKTIPIGKSYRKEFFQRLKLI